MASWETHETEKDCLLVIRTNTGIALYRQFSPIEFINSPNVTREYFHCLHLLRPGEEEIDDFYIEDACDWHVKVCYDRLEDILIKPPTRVIAGETVCFFKRLEVSFGPKHAKSELMALRRTARLPDAPVAYTCRLHGVVRNGQEIVGMLFSWIEKKGVLCRIRANDAPANVRRRWTDQISQSLQVLHEHGIVWSDAKAENILIDQEDNAWIIDFGGSYTLGWDGKDKAGTIEGDKQGLEKILDMPS